MDCVITTTADYLKIPQSLSVALPTFRDIYSRIKTVMVSSNGQQTSSSVYALSPSVSIVPATSIRISDNGSAYNDSSITSIGSCDVSMNMKSISKLRSFLRLPDNWNGYGARQFSPGYLKYAESLLKSIPFKTEVFPIPDGRVQFEFDKDDGAYLEFEINDDYTIGVFEILADESEREYKATPEDLLRIVTDFYG